MIPATTLPPEFVYRGEYRPRGSRGGWLTYCERPSASSAWDELLTAPGLAGVDLRVRRVETPAQPVAVGA
jgi:hypothetical protein